MEPVWHFCFYIFLIGFIFSFSSLYNHIDITADCFFSLVLVFPSSCVYMGYREGN